MASELVRELVNSGIHFGHRVSRWNPKMSQYIFGRRNLIHIIDIRETVKGLLRAKKFITQVVGRGGEVLFVGTKRQARQTLIEQATRVGMPYVARRWLGGTLTNFRTIRSRLARLEELEGIEADGRLAEYSKKAIAVHNRELRKIKANLEGMRTMENLPAAVLVVDVRREHLAVREAKKLGIPTVCLIDTDSDPDFADIPIPGNDDSMRSIETILKHLADAVEEGKRASVAAGAAAEKESSFQRRSQRPTMGRAEDAEAKPADGEEGVSASPEADTVAAPVSTEMASESTPPVDPPAAAAAEGADREVPAVPETSP
ncbi:MAG: 30S ribosomal protein S2 [Planctomycetes bacterium]|nr:30S ribosomal protein S2 [Planctomycetota bacterium]